MPKALAKKGKPAATRKGEGKKRNVNNSSSKKERKPRSETYVVCPYTDQKVWISKATVSDLKPSGKNTSNIHKNDSKKRLWTISSSQIRHDHYAEVAQALSIYEQNLLPSSGGRSWEVTVQLSEPNARILFRSWKGRMELACLPHLIDRIPRPPVWPGKRNQPADDYRAMQGEEEDVEYTYDGGRKRIKKNTKQDYIKGLTSREISMLSQVAWDVLKPKYDHPAPTVTIKWKSPDAKTFTSRKSAWEHATKLSKQEVAIDRNLLGIGASGKLLKEFFPSAKTAIEVGKMRFERDGLWVVGQENSWQADREDELMLQDQEREEAAASKVYTSGLQLYVAENRHSYRDEHGTNLVEADKALRHQWRCLPPKEQERWNDKVQEQFEDDDDSSSEEEGGESGNDKDTTNPVATKDDNTDSDSESDDESSVEVISHYQYFLRQRRHNYRHEQQMKLEAIAANSKGTKRTRFTLAQADKELKQQWREMEEEQQDEWIAKLKRMEEEEEEVNETKNGMKQQLHQPQSENSGDEILNLDAGVVTAAGEETEAKIIVENTDFHFRHPITTAGIAMDHGEMESSNFEEEKKIDDDDQFAATPTEEIAKSSGKKSKRKPPTKTKQRAKTTKTPSTTKPTTKASTRKKRQSTPKYCLKPDQISQCHEACMEHYETVMRTVKTRDLSRELADGFDVLRERGHGRFDMELPAFDDPGFDFLTDLGKTPWMPIVRAILGQDAVLIHKGCFMSLPGAGSQVYHQDGVHLTTQSQRPCHAINVFVPLVDLHSRNGPTEFVLGSHVLGHDGYDRDFLETPKPTAGTPVVFDYRLGHRGLGNSSTGCRPIVYCTYARAADGRAFRDSVNFSRKRYHKIGELSAKPLSREERRNKRKRSIESAREKKELDQTIALSATETETPVVAGEEPLSVTVVDSSVCEAGPASIESQKRVKEDPRMAEDGIAEAKEPEVENTPA